MLVRPTRRAQVLQTGEPIPGPILEVQKNRSACPPRTQRARYVLCVSLFGFFSGFEYSEAPSPSTIRYGHSPPSGTVVGGCFRMLFVWASLTDSATWSWLRITISRQFGTRLGK